MFTRGYWISVLDFLLAVMGSPTHWWLSDHQNCILRFEDRNRRVVNFKAKGTMFAYVLSSFTLKHILCICLVHLGIKLWIHIPWWVSLITRARVEWWCPMAYPPRQSVHFHKWRWASDIPSSPCLAPPRSSPSLARHSAPLSPDFNDSPSWTQVHRKGRPNIICDVVMMRSL